MKNRYRQNETWISNKFVGQLGIEAFMPNANMGLEEKGFKHADIQRASSRMTCLRAMPKAWCTVAAQQEKLAKEAEERGHGVTAGAFYHRAALYYGKAQLYHHKDDERKLKMHADCVRCYEKAIQYYDYTIERVVLPFGDHKLYGIFHAPKNVTQKIPAVLFTPGMDMIKEDYPNLNDNFFVRRNMAVLVMDGPGFGETRVHGLPVTLDNFPEAGKLFIDYLCGRPEVNPDQIGIFGGSMGSYYGPLVAAHDSRVKAIVGLLGCYLEKELQFNSCQPGLRSNFKYMANVYDDEEFEKMTEQMTLEKVVDRLKVPFLMSTGEYDEMCPPELTKRFFDMLRCPKEIWIMEDEFHSCAGMYHELFAWAIDWLRDALTKGVGPNHAVEKVIPSRK